MSEAEKFKVMLRSPNHLYAEIEVQAEDEDEAETLALNQQARGEVTWTDNNGDERTGSRDEVEVMGTQRA